jgi:hypothetical protein
LNAYFTVQDADNSCFTVFQALITGEEYRSISTDAKLYMACSGPHGLSVRNSWLDEIGFV